MQTWEIVNPDDKWPVTFKVMITINGDTGHALYQTVEFHNNDEFNRYMAQFLEYPFHSPTFTVGTSSYWAYRIDVMIG